jgi:hypothetical protein
VATICILWFWLEVGGVEVVANEKRVFEVGDYKNSFGESVEKLPKDREKGEISKPDARSAAEATLKA